MISITESQIMQNWITDSSHTLVVSVLCSTYNHELYIAQTLDSLLMQETNFPFEVVVHDDASTDGTAGIIREYETKFPNIIKPIYETENQYSKSIGLLMQAVFTPCKGKYISICEGDDYWLDKHKLQLQVDFLEVNCNYGFIYGNAVCFIQKTGKFGPILGRKISSISQLITYGNTIPTCSTMFKTELLKKYISEVKPYEKNWLMGDYPLNLWFSYNSKIKYIRKTLSVYRILDESASHSDNLNACVRFSKSTNEILRFYKEKYALSVKLPDHVAFSKFAYYLSRNDRNGILDNADFYWPQQKTFFLKLKLFIFKHDFTYRLYCLIKSLI